MPRRPRQSKEAILAGAERGLRDGATSLCKEAAAVVGPAMLWAALCFLGEDAVAAHPHSTPSPKNKRGPVRDPLVTARYVYTKLCAAQFDDGDLVRLIRSSDTDWVVPPCPELVAMYREDNYSGTGHGRLKNRLKQLIRARGWKG